MIVDSAPPLYGGAGQQAALLASVLRERGHDVRILARQKTRVVKNPPGTTFVRPFLGRGRASSWYFALASALAVLTSRVDVVHCHGAYPFAVTATWAAQLRRLPTIVKVTLVGSDDPVSVAQKRIGPFPTGRWSSRLFLRADRIIAVTSAIAEIIARGAPGAHVAVVPNGVTMRVRFGPLPGTSPRVIFVGALSRRKGVDTLLSAWSAFRAAHPSATLTLVGPETNEGVLAYSGGEADGVTVAGMLAPEGVSSALIEANIFVLPSLSEGQPNALIEAMSAGLACVATDIPANRLTGRDAVEYAEPGDAASLANALERAWQAREALGARARAGAGGFDIQTVAQTYESLYAELSSRKERTR